VHCRVEAASDDRELLRRVGERRDDAFAVLLQRHGPMVLNSARRITGDEQLAEDVFQATFLLLSRKAPTIRRAEALPCWLHSVARRLAVQARRALARRREREARVQPRSSADPLEELSARELVAVLDEEIGRLPESQRAVVILCCLEGLSQEEAARRLGCSVAAVKGRLERGRQRLRLRLEKRGLTLPAVLGGTMLLAGATSPVPAALTQTTLQVAARGSTPSAAVAALLEEAMQMMFVSKFKAICGAVLLLAVTGTGMGMLALLPQPATEDQPQAKVNDKPLAPNKRVDLYGDPLPEGAVMRLGTLRQRAVSAALAVSADGNSIIGVRGGKSIRIWDALTGELRQMRELPGDPLSPPVLSKDGRFMARAEFGPERLEIWDPRTGQKVRELAIKDIGKSTGGVWPIVFSADAKRIAAIGHRRRTNPSNESEHLIRAWDLADGKEIFSKNVRNNVSTDVLAFTPDGNRLLASFTSTDAGLYCWDIATGKKLWQFKKFGSPCSIECTPDGKILSSGLGPQTLDLATGETNPIKGAPPIQWDRRVTLTPDGRTILISTANGLIVWDLILGKELWTLPGAGEEVVVTPDGKAVITNNGALQRWDLATGKAVWSDTSELGHIGEVSIVQFSADGERLVSASTDGTLRLWDTTTSRPLRVWHGHQGKRPVRVMGYIDAGVKILDLSADGRRIVSAGSDERIKVWDIDSDKEVRTIALPPAESGVRSRRIYNVRISRDGRRVTGIFGPYGVTTVAGQLPPKLTNKLALWNAETGSLLDLQPAAMGGGLLSPDRHTLLTRNSAIDVRSGKVIAKLPNMYLYGREGSSAFSFDGALIVGQATKERKEKEVNIVSSDGLRVWEAATGKVVAGVEKKLWVAQTAFLPDNRFIVTNDLDGIHILDARSGDVVARFTMPEAVRASTTFGSYAGCLTFRRDGRRMATGMPDGTILVWNVSLPSARALRLSTKELEASWTDLAAGDAAKAWRAVWRLADAPQDALAFLGGRVNPYLTASADVTRKLLTDLEGDSFEAREAAVKQLKELGLQAEPALRAALKARPSLEQRRRIEELIAALPVVSHLSPEELRQLRALIVLECIGTPEARRLLEEAAKGPSSARLTRQALSSLACIR
jgi:RNA polymerase sigma factor (sigma-70 family)